ncbi:uncharacterized protein LOC110662940 [Hevea brasiliensis]|uniref:uncharacterized protein LOC110662940 n=1 Tax=Hevea brasiliensis TaxID=3981 RepID=UPI000B78010C|nr:uncharacterized protein LOC110662940 [Hevea brasiliensis]
MASSGYSAPPPPVFFREGYSIWAVKMKAYLKAFDLWEVIETGRIMTCETAKQAWDRLKEEFHGSESLKQMSALNFRREFNFLKMRESKTLKEYTDRLMFVVNKIRMLGEDLPDKRVVEKVLVSLPDRFEPKISSLEDS